MATLSHHPELPEVEQNLSDDPRTRAPLVTGGLDLHGLTERVAGLAGGWPKLWWWITFIFSFSLMNVFFLLIGYLVFTGVGVWGNNQPVAWGFPIVNFVFWVGIGHAGTLISAIL